jgi:GntR family transcriptional repressor for pyruvate dehydrogenase complex
MWNSGSGAVSGRRGKLYKEVAARIRELISSGELEAGQALPSERKLAAQFEVGRAVIREAVRQLEASGLVESRHGGGNYVREITSEHLVAPIASLLNSKAQLREELMDARSLFEPQVAREAAIRATPEDLLLMEAVVVRQAERVSKGQPTAEEDAEFHALLAHATRNSVVERVMGVIDDLLEDVYERLSQHGERSQLSLEGNRRILEAVQSRDPDAAQRAMAEHIEDIAAHFHPGGGIHDLEHPDAAKGA